MALQEFRTWLQEDEEAASRLDCPAGEVVVACKAKREPGRINEDAAAVFPLPQDRAVLVVADGMGGGAQGEVASGIVVHEIAERLRGWAEDGSHQELRSTLIEAIDLANQRIMEMGVGAGTTVVIAIVTPTEYSTLHAGDSVAIVAGQKGRLKTQTVAHSPVGYAVESGLLSPDEALLHPERHVVSNMVGMQQMRIELSAVHRFNPKDTLALASDGLFDNLTVDEIVEGMRAGDLVESAQGLVDLANRRMLDPRADEPSKPDDLAMILFRPGRAPDDRSA